MSAALSNATVSTTTTNLLADNKPISFDEVELTAKQARDWERARTRFMYLCPAFTHVLYKMCNTRRAQNKAVFTKQVPIAATDGTYLVINPETFFDGKYTLPHQTFIMAHEVLHCIFNHCGLGVMYRRRGKVALPNGTDLPYDDDTANVALDYIINAILATSVLPGDTKPMFEAPPDALCDPAFISGDDTFPTAYAKVYKDKQTGKGRGGKRFDEHLAPGTAEGKSVTTAQSERNETEWKTEVAAGMEAAKAQGRLPASMQRMFEELLTPKVNWQDHIQGFFRRKVGGGAWDWQRPDRRLIIRKPFLYAPARSGHGCERVVVACDTSGSVNNATLAMFLAEVGGVLEGVRPRQIDLVWCDAEVNRVDELYDGSDLGEIKSKGAVGGGGTNFCPVFDWITENGVKPDALLYLTDGLGQFPSERVADYPVLWGSIYAEPSHYPFGEVVMIPKQA